MAEESAGNAVASGRWDAICVGAGITSLAFGAQLALRHPEARVLVIDKHTVPGGYATVFRRPKSQAVFDCSLHKLSGMLDGGNLRRIFAELGLAQDLALRYPEDYFEACLPGGAFTLGNDPQAVRRALTERYPLEREALDRFFGEVEVHGRNGYYQFQMLEGNYLPEMAELRYAHKFLKNVSVSQALRERFRDGYLKELLAATGIYVGGFPEDLGYLYFLHVVYATLYRGNAYVVGASQRLSDALAGKITGAGGAVMLGTTVRRVITNAANEAVGVATSRGDFFARTVYINASPHYALGALFEPSAEMNAVAQKLRGLKPSRSTTTLYLTTDTDPAELGLTSTETMVFGAAHDECLAARAQAERSSADAVSYEHAFWRCSPMEVTNYHALDPAGGRVICANVLDSIAHWPERRAKEYKRKKARAAQVLTERLLAAKPRIAGRIVSAEISSPRTYLRFTNNTDGAGYGAAVGTDASGHGFHYNFPVKGVHFLSAWVAGPSYEAAFGFAEMKAKQWPAAQRPPRH